MVITKTPFRLSFFGGGTDYKEFFNEYEGSVLETTIDKYCYVSARKLPRFFEYDNQIVYSKIECTRSIDDIEHPTAREALKMLEMSNIRIVYDADLPARAGLGSSSSFSVGMLNALHAIKGEFIDKYHLAKEAICIERERCAESGGWQDQIAVSYGGLNRIYFSNNDYRVEPVIISEIRKKKLNSNLFLFFTGFSRFSHQYSEEQKKNIKNKKKDLLEMLHLVDDAERILCSESNLDEFGKLLDYTWKLKRGITEHISNNNIDELYKVALKNGALGGKLLGAGGGGFIIFYVPIENQKQFLYVMKDIMNVPFYFENVGTSVIYSMEDERYW